MRIRICDLILASVLVWTWNGSLQAEAKLEPVAALPDGLTKDIAAVMQSGGQGIADDSGPICAVWLAKELPAQAGFKPTLSIKYPFAVGELVGVLQVQAKSKFTDFRGQEIKPGVFTLRYGQQPEDGNHLGTSDLADFLLAIPAALDTDPKPISGFDPLTQRSAKASGATHPAIFSLLPADKPSDKPTLSADKEKHLSILNTTVSIKGGSKLPLRLVVIGKSAE